jgi:hypothetical protein
MKNPSSFLLGFFIKGFMDMQLPNDVSPIY